MTRTTKVLQVDTSNFAAYNSDDLDYFQEILEDVLAELRNGREITVSRESEEALRVQMAVAIFKCADDGERDYDLLRQRALAAISRPGEEATGQAAH